MLHTINYKFSQTFNAPAERAYRWCTDFSSNDPELMAEKNAVRKVKKLTGKTVILKETFQTDNGSIVKEKLVQLYPERLTWVSTHISGPNKYSQFIYEIQAETSSTSRLDFTAQHIEHQEKMTPTELKALAEALCKYDSNIWKLLAAAMKQELGA